MDINVEKLIEKAKTARGFAYSPYSRFQVGAAVLMKDGTYFSGCNIENSSYGLCNCAERTALFKMISEGYHKEDVLAMAVVGQTKAPISPCGACRQVMVELLPQTTPVYLSNLKGDLKKTTVRELLPYAFEEIEHEGC